MFKNVGSNLIAANWPSNKKSCPPREKNDIKVHSWPLRNVVEMLEKESGGEEEKRIEGGWLQSASPWPKV